MTQKHGSHLASRNVPDSDHLMRFVPYKEQLRDPDNDSFKGIVETAFSIRQNDDGGLSLTWVEHYGPKNQQTYQVAAARFRDSLVSRKLGGKSCFAIGQAGETRKTCSEFGKRIRLVHAPNEPNAGHVELRRFSDDDRRLLDALAIDVFREHVLTASLNLG